MGILPGEDTFNSVTEVLLSFSLACQSCRESKGKLSEVFRSRLAAYKSPT